MANENRPSEKPEYPTSFGLFYPVGYLVVGFPGREDALRALSAVCRLSLQTVTIGSQSKNSIKPY